MPIRRVHAWLNPDHEPVLLQDPLRSEVVELLRATKAVEAMRLTNRRTGIGLAATKRTVDHIAEAEGLDARI